MRIGKLEIRIIKDDSELGFRETKKVVKDFDSLLNEIELTNPDYEVILDPKQASGFFPKNGSTKVAINSLHYNSLHKKLYTKFLDRLAKITKNLSKSYSIARASFYE